MEDIKINRVSIIQRLQKTKKDRCKKTATPHLNTSESDEPEKLQEPEEKVKLFERAVGFFNADTDETSQKNILNQSVEKGPPYVCTICQNWFYLGSKLKIHYILNHGYWHCEICSILFDNPEDKSKHLREYHQPIFCEICQKDYKTQDDLIKHYEEEHNSSTCVFCGLLIQPKTLLQEHLTKKHQIHEDYLKISPEKFIENAEYPDFYCNLCRKKRSVDVMFGHMFSFHKMALTSLMNLLAQGCEIKCDGTSKELIKCEAESCQVCGLKYLKKLPENFHLSYCQGRLFCKHCGKNFSSILHREKHLEKHHNKFACRQNCPELEFNCEDTLNKHYIKIHENVACTYCDLFVPVAGYEQHLTEIHGYKAELMKNFKDSLFEVVDRDNKHIVICCLCDENITKLTEEPKSIYSHYEKNHQMSQKCILDLCSVKPSLEDYDELFREINEHLNDLNERDIEILLDQDHENACEVCNHKFPDFTTLSEHIVEHKFKFNLSDLEELKCYKCDEQFTIKLLKQHFFTTHPDLPQFKHFFYKCLRCNLTYPMVRHKCPPCPPQKPKKSKTCDICKKEFKTCRATSIHKLMKHERKLFGFQCRICQEKFQTMEQRKLHYSTAHPGQLAYSCVECGKGFISKSGLYGHRKIHQEHETLTCPYCNKDFTVCCPKREKKWFLDLWSWFKF